MTRDDGILSPMTRVYVEYEERGTILIVCVHSDAAGGHEVYLEAEEMNALVEWWAHQKQEIAP